MLLDKKYTMKSNKVVIDILKRNNLPFINRIINKPEVSKYFNFVPPLTLEKTIEWFKEVKKKREEKRGECFVALMDKKVVGWCYGFVNAEIKERFLSILKPHIEKIKDNECGYLAAIVVDPEYKGRGIGSKLLSELHTYLKKIGAKCIWLGVNSDNIFAKKIYEKFGYRLIGYVPNFKRREDGRMINQEIYIKFFD